MTASNITSNILVSSLLSLSMLGTALASTSFAQTSSSESPYTPEKIDAFCADSGAALPPAGVQPNGERALSTVMQLSPGLYQYPNGGVLLLFSNKTFFIKVPAVSNTLSGTSGPDMLYAGQRVIGGCSAEQLSEVVVANSLDAESFQPKDGDSANTSSGNSAVPADVVAAVEAINEFCNERENRPQPGMQFDGKAASSEVLSLTQGIYTYPNDGLLVFIAGQYILQLPTTRQGIYGTDGDDYITGSGVVAGCSAEQLSEAIANNNISLSSLQLVRSYESDTP